MFSSFIVSIIIKKLNNESDREYRNICNRVDFYYYMSNGYLAQTHNLMSTKLKQIKCILNLDIYVITLFDYDTV